MPFLYIILVCERLWWGNMDKILQTKVFNKIVDKKYPFIFNQEVREKWDIDCLMAYIATWGA